MKMQVIGIVIAIFVLAAMFTGGEALGMDPVSVLGGAVAFLLGRSGLGAHDG